MGRQSYRDKLVEAGTRTVHERGFATVGIREITAAAGVAQGSFTNHFASKDAFGLVVLDHYFDRIRGVIAATLEDEGRRPIARLRAYFDAMIQLFESSGWRYGCLAGNMGLEAAEHSEQIRERLSAIFVDWTIPFSRVIGDAQREGDLSADLDAEQTGAALLDAWHGAMLRMKIDRSPSALKRFLAVTFPSLLGGTTR